MGHVSEYISVTMNHWNWSIVEIIDIELCQFSLLDNIGIIQNCGYLQNKENLGDMNDSPAFYSSFLSFWCATSHGLKMFYFDLLFDPYQSLTWKVKLRSKGHSLNWVIIVYMHTKYESNCFTGSWDMPNYVFWTSGDLVSKVKGQLWPHSINGSCVRIYQCTNEPLKWVHCWNNWHWTLSFSPIG